MRIEPDMRVWTGRVDHAEGPAGRRWHQQMRPLETQTSGVALLGFACDAGVERNHGRIGAHAGPLAIRRMLANLPVPGSGNLIDAGDVQALPGTDDDGLEAAQEALSGHVADLLARGLFPLVLGGGHEVAFGSFGGLARHLARHLASAPANGAPRPPRIGIINLDAHFDLRMANRASSGTPFRQISEDCQARGWPFHYCCLGVSEFANTVALFQRAEALGVLWRRDTDMDLSQRDATLAQLDGFLSNVDHVYLTVCLDVLPAAVAPGVSAPAACGVALDVIEPIVDAVGRSGKLRLADIAEMNPCFDIDGRTARVAARLVARIAASQNPRMQSALPCPASDAERYQEIGNS